MTNVRVLPNTTRDTLDLWELRQQVDAIIEMLDNAQPTDQNLSQDDALKLGNAFLRYADSFDEDEILARWGDDF